MWSEFYATLVSKDSSYLFSAPKCSGRSAVAGKLWKHQVRPRWLNGTDGSTCCCCSAAHGTSVPAERDLGSTTPQLCSDGTGTCSATCMQLGHAGLTLLSCTLHSCSSCCLYLAGLAPPWHKPECATEGQKKPAENSALFWVGYSDMDWSWLDLQS